MPRETAAQPRRGAVVAILGLLCLVPPLVHNPYLLHLCILSMIYAMLGASWNLINGYAGIFTFGHQAFFGLGAYSSALLAMHSGLSPWITLWCGGVVAAFAGLVIGLPVLRIRSIAHVAIITLAFAVIVHAVVSNLPELTRGTLGLAGIPPFTPIVLPRLGTISFGAGASAASYYVALAFLTLSAALLIWVVSGRTGLALRAIRDSEAAAASLGVDPTRYKLLAFIVSSFVAGVAGAYYAHYLGVLTPESSIGVPIMITVLVITLVGGIGTTVGPLIGAFLVIIGLEVLRSVGDYRLMVYGVLLVLFVNFAPNGLAQLTLFDRRRGKRR
ncbi:MAG TPA: branched-chain amino acid ABC transporter permease [Xanthobacteraceae bacterium]|nr:branched-chain amino acid ABC transporter permease [Xanthobacteraceae bacterium]